MEPFGSGGGALEPAPLPPPSARIWTGQRADLSWEAPQQKCAKVGFGNISSQKFIGSAAFATLFFLRQILVNKASNTNLFCPQRWAEKYHLSFRVRGGGTVPGAPCPCIGPCPSVPTLPPDRVMAAPFRWAALMWLLVGCGLLAVGLCGAPAGTGPAAAYRPITDGLRVVQPLAAARVSSALCT